MKNDSDIIIRPNIRYWIIRIIPYVFLETLIIYIVNLFNLNDYIIGSCTLVVFFSIFYKYLSILLCTKWIITKEQIKIYSGVFNKSINYIELYRVYDYEEKRSFILSLIQCTNVYIHSGDKSTPILAIYGINRNIDLIGIIRKRVESQKQIKSIYEFTNR